MFGSNLGSLKAKLRRQYGTDPTEDAWHSMREARLPRIRIYHDCEEQKEKASVDEITWNDLEMDRVFFRIDHTRSVAGEQMLYRLLHDPRLPEKEKKVLLQNATDFDVNEELRLSLEERLCKAGQREDDYYLPQFMEEPSLFAPDHPIIYKILMVLLGITLTASIVTRNSYCMMAFLVCLVINLFVYLSARMKYDIVLSSLGSAGKLLNLCAGFAADKELKEHIPDTVREDTKNTSKIRSSIQLYTYLKTGATSGDLIAMMLEFLMGITLIDLARLDTMLRRLEEQRDEVMRLFRFAGMLDCAIAVASYRKSLEYYCEPEFTVGKENGEEVIDAKALYHPLLSDPVSNDAVLGRRTMFTGANASGKSTFLKSVAINMILGQTIGTCTAEHFAAPKMKIMTSMAIRDDISTGESYYIREVKYLKRMLDVIDEGVPVLCIIDEILKGTNETERIAASQAVLSYMAKKNCFILAASHDLQMVRSMADIYDNLHFESRIEEGSIVFDYILREGIGDGTNAIDLMRSFGFPEEVITDARANVLASKNKES